MSSDDLRVLSDVFDRNIIVVRRMKNCFSNFSPQTPGILAKSWKIRKKWIVGSSGNQTSCWWCFHCFKRLFGDFADADNFTVTFDGLETWSEEKKSMKFLQFSFRSRVEFSAALLRIKFTSVSLSSSKKCEIKFLSVELSSLERRKNISTHSSVISVVV